MHLHQFTASQCLCDLVIVVGQQFRGEQLQRHKLDTFDVVSIVLAETEQKDPTATPTSSNQCSRSATLAATRERHTLLDDATTQISIDQPVTHLQNGLPEDRVRQSTLFHPSGEGAGSENTIHRSIPLSAIPKVLPVSRHQPWQGTHDLLRARPEMRGHAYCDHDFLSDLPSNGSPDPTRPGVTLRAPPIADCVPTVFPTP